MFRIILPLAAALSLTACMGPDIVRAEPIDGTISGQCKIDMVRGIVGLAATASTVDRARVDSDSLGVRVLRQSKNTTETSADASDGSRLTIVTGAHNAITSVYCG
ncbi:MAG: hypothetical protein LBL59_02025 [Xanthomonadaceae bacterium]|jgi:hypothetical protein|nr:hypothetical protein [Xanthomonadaceae bacterium]